MIEMYTFRAYSADGSISPDNRWRPLIGMVASTRPVPLGLKRTQDIYYIRKPLKMPRKPFIGHLVHCFGGVLDDDVKWVPEREFKLIHDFPEDTVERTWIYNHVLMTGSGQWRITKDGLPMYKAYDRLLMHRKSSKIYSKDYLRCLFRHYNVRLV